MLQLRLTAVFVLVFLLAGCGGDVDADKAENQLKNGIEAQGKADVKYVKCPSGVKAEKGATFQCEALIPVNVTQVDDNGNVRWQITSFIGPPAGNTGATGATGVTGATGTTPPGGVATPPSGSTPPAGGGKDDPRFEKYTNRAQGYSISHPILWKRVGSGKDVTFPFPNGSRFIHVVIQDVGGLPTIAQMKGSLKAQEGVQRTLTVKKDRVAGQPVIYAEYLFRAQGAPTNVVIKRYIFNRGGRRASVELAANQPLADKKPLLKKFERTINSFRWLGAGT